MIKPASSLCNLRCKYCFYANVSDLREVKSYGIMSDEIVEKMLAKIYDELSDTVGTWVRKANDFLLEIGAGLTDKK